LSADIHGLKKWYLLLMGAYLVLVALQGYQMYKTHLEYLQKVITLILAVTLLEYLVKWTYMSLFDKTNMKSSLLVLVGGLF
jgi:hypothetical protein